MKFPQFFVARSIESFERKLEDKQKSLNIPSRDFIPILYQDETDYAAELLRYIPFVVLFGR